MFCKAGEQGVTPLHLAAFNGHRDALVILVSRFSNIDLCDGLGRSPLYLASYSGKSDCVVLLLEQGALVTSNNTISGLTPVHAAARQGHLETLRTLLDNTEEASVVNTPDTCLAATPLMLAAYHGHKRCVELLLEYGSNEEVVDLEGRSALIWAVLAGQDECVKVLGAGRGAGQRDRRGRSAHHVAAVRRI